MTLWTLQKITFAVLMFAALAGQAGCATQIPVERIVADAGVRSARALAIDVDNFAGRLEEGDAVAAFVATWRSCEGARPQCEITAPPAAEREQRQELAEAVALRAEAVIAIHTAYTAFQGEISVQRGADSDRAISSALQGTATYAASLTGIPLVRTAIVGRPLEHLVGTLSTALSSQQRRLRTRAANRDLGHAIRELREAMSEETRKYDALAEVLVTQRTQAHRAMLQAGLISGAGTLKPFSDRLNVPLSRDAEAVVTRSASARTAIEAMVEANERREIMRTQSRYRAAIATLIELEEVHAVMDRGERPDMSSLERAVWNLERLSDPLIAPSRVLGTPLTSQPVG